MLQYLRAFILTCIFYAPNIFICTSLESTVLYYLNLPTLLSVLHQHPQTSHCLYNPSNLVHP
uniref:Uncharacterized protein n=1 Tax=Physcomitrium patens TaxID=3218 RepID=A0A2K1JJA7_PHYPA|nr:hypothetical protein PHYPA_019041 [Physcomitrium patens]PNR41637.1 hypothetical protein PHYPA_019042 [Physcomitrium patens]